MKKSENIFFNSIFYFLKYFFEKPWLFLYFLNIVASFLCFSYFFFKFYQLFHFFSFYFDRNLFIYLLPIKSFIEKSVHLSSFFENKSKIYRQKTIFSQNFLDSHRRKKNCFFKFYSRFKFELGFVAEFVQIFKLIEKFFQKFYSP